MVAPGFAFLMRSQLDYAAAWQPQGFSGAAIVKRDGNVTVRAAFVTMPSSIGSPGFGGVPPPTRAAFESV
jgi:hypothetical protein